MKQLSIYHGTTYFVSWGSKEDKEKLFQYLYGENKLQEAFYFKRKYLRMHESLYGNNEITN